MSFDNSDRARPRPWHVMVGAHGLGGATPLGTAHWLALEAAAKKRRQQVYRHDRQRDDAAMTRDLPK